MAYITVIVPMYNAEKTIERCVKSICRQTFTDLEIIVIDDGSRDGGGELCDALARTDSRITVLHKQNGGVSAARNSGIALAKGQYIQFVDSDDYIPDDYCEQLVEAQKKFGPDAFIWAGIDIVSDNGTVASQNIRYSTSEYDVVNRSDVLKLSANFLLNALYNKLYHANIIKANDLRMDERISIAEDLLFNLEYLNAAKECSIVILNDAAYDYVRNGQPSLDYGYKKNYYNIHKRVLDVLSKYCKEWQVPQEDLPLYYKRYWDYMQNAFFNLELEDCELSGFQKFWEKSKITADKHFQKSLLQQKHKHGRGSYLMWRSRIYLFVYLYEKVRKRI